MYWRQSVASGHFIASYRSRNGQFVRLLLSPPRRDAKQGKCAKRMGWVDGFGVMQEGWPNFGEGCNAEKAEGNAYFLFKKGQGPDQAPDACGT